MSRVKKPENKKTHKRKEVMLSVIRKIVGPKAVVLASTLALFLGASATSASARPIHTTMYGISATPKEGARENEIVTFQAQLITQGKHVPISGQVVSFNVGWFDNRDRTCYTITTTADGWAIVKVRVPSNVVPPNRRQICRSFFVNFEADGKYYVRHSSSVRGFTILK